MDAPGKHNKPKPPSHHTGPVSSQGEHPVQTYACYGHPPAPYSAPPLRPYGYTQPQATGTRIRGLIVLCGLCAITVGISVLAAFLLVPRPPDHETHPSAPSLTSDTDDENWGRLDYPVNRATVTFILISWDGSPRGESRTQDEARRLAVELWWSYRDNPTAEHWHMLQARYQSNHDVPGTEYDVYPEARLVPEFIETGLTTEVGYARISEPSHFGYFLIRRER